MAVTGQMVVDVKTMTVTILPAGAEVVPTATVFEEAAPLGEVVK